MASKTVKTQTEVAAFFNVSLRQVQNWIKDGCPKQQANGLYDLQKIVEWRQAKQTSKRKPLKKNKWEEKYRRAKALLAETELKKKTGDLMDRKTVEDGRVQRILEVKRRLLALPHQLAPQVIGKDIREVEAIIETRIIEVINAFARKN